MIKILIINVKRKDWRESSVKEEKLSLILITQVKELDMEEADASAQAGELETGETMRLSGQSSVMFS